MDPSRPTRPPSRNPRPLRAKRARDTVEIPRAWLAPIAGGLIVLLLLVAYLVGRESGRRATEMAKVEPPAAALRESLDPTPMVPAEAPPAPVPPPQRSADGVRYAPWTPEALPDADPQPPGWPAAEPPSAVDPQGAAVAAYFAEIEALEQQAKYWSNPQELAMSLVGQGARGDTSGMRQLLETQRSAQRQIESMIVPPACQEHHRRTVEMLGRALELLEGLEGGLASGNVEGLLALSGEARQLEAATREVDALASQIKNRYGLAGS